MTNLQQTMSLSSNAFGLWGHIRAGLMEGMKSVPQGAATYVKQRSVQEVHNPDGLVHRHIVGAFDPNIKGEAAIPTLLS